MRARSAVVAALLFATVARGQSLVEHYHAYVQALLDGDREAARAAWWPADLEFAERLGLRWQHDLPKIDAESPLLQALPRLRSGELQLEIVERDGGLDLSLRDEHGVRRQRVEGMVEDGRWWLRHPVLRALEAFPYQSVGPLRLVHPSQPGFAPAALEANLRFVEDCIERLELDDRAVDALRRRGLVVLWGGDALLEELVGVRTEGVANVALDLLLTRHAYHPHELVHLLHGLALGERVTPIHPLLQEGLAVWLGGRWDSSAQEQLEFGAVVLDHQLIDLDALLDADRFGREPADFSYPASALVVATLHERIGMRRLLALSRELRLDETASRTRTRLLDACACDDREFQRALRSDVVRLRAQGIQPAEPPRRAADFAWSSGSLQLRLWFQGRTLFGEAGFGPAADASSRIEVDFPELPGRRLRIQPGEVGVYDLVLDKRLAKRAYGFEVEPGFWDAARGRISFAVPRERIGSQTSTAIVIESTE